MQDKTQQIFRDAPVPKAVLTNVIPSIISMLMVLVYNLADTFFIGQTKDPLMVAAVSIATPAFIIFMAVGMLFGIGGTSMISRMLGEGKRDMAKHISAFCFWTRCFNRRYSYDNYDNIFSSRMPSYRCK